MIEKLFILMKSLSCLFLFYIKIIITIILQKVCSKLIGVASKLPQIFLFCNFEQLSCNTTSGLIAFSKHPFKAFDFLL